MRILAYLLHLVKVLINALKHPISKVRLVAEGYIQIDGIDYKETFALVANVNTICFLLSLTTNLGWFLS